MNAEDDHDVRPNVLVVDDTSANLHLLSQLLSRRGYKVRVANDGSRALESVRANPPDLILLDIMMPGIDGYQVCTQLKAQPATRDIPVIFLSALDTSADKVKAFGVGGADYVTKPFSAEEVMARVQTHLALRDFQRRLQEANNDLERRVAERTAQLAALNAAYERFVPREFLVFLHKQSAIDVCLGDQVQQDMTIMFADIRDFTARSEQMTPQENFNFLNAYLGQITPIIADHGGIIDKYLGDGVMALFPGTPDTALQAALAMQHAVADYNSSLERSGQAPLAIGIGLHTGSSMLGIIGDERRLQGTVISDAVNLAARLQNLCKVYGASIIASAQVLESSTHPEQYPHRYVGQVRVRGKHEPVSVVEILSAAMQLKLAARQVFEKGLRLYYAAQFAEAHAEFQRVLEQNPADRAAGLYVQRTAQWMQTGVPAGWSGIEEAES